MSSSHVKINKSDKCKEIHDYKFDSLDFGYENANDGLLDSIVIISLPNAGTLTFNGAKVEINQKIALIDIQQLFFSTTIIPQESNYADFNFSYQKNQQQIITVNIISLAVIRIKR